MNRSIYSIFDTESEKKSTLLFVLVLFVVKPVELDPVRNKA
jgi:hypothetical protein